jgi:hypothetical protein
MKEPDLLTEKYERIKSILNERDTRLILASEAVSLGHGGISFSALNQTDTTS